MSGIGEALTVIAVVAGLVSAFRDGGAIVEKIKERRRIKNKPPPTTELEESLEDGETEIRKAAARGESRLGEDFRAGDDPAIQALQTVTIEVQSSMLKHLREAVKDDDMNDFGECIDSIIEARLRAVTTLNELYLRQRDAVKRRTTISSTETTPLSPPPSFASLPDQPIPPSRTATETSMPAERSSIFSKKPRRPTNDSLGPEEGSLSGSPTNNSTLTLESVASRDSGFFGPRRIRSNTPKHETVVYLASPTQRASTATTAAANPPTSSPRSSTASLHSSQSRTLSTVPTQNPGNLCEGAYYVQYTASTATSTTDPLLASTGFQLSKDKKSKYWKCRRSKCSFQGIAKPTDPTRPELGYGYDPTARRAGPLRYRWLFLAKSHAVQGKDDFMRKSRCLVCRLLLASPSSPSSSAAAAAEEGASPPQQSTANANANALYEGDTRLLAHVNKHAGQTVSGVRLSGPISFRHDRVVPSDEAGFDVDFPVSTATTITTPPSAIPTPHGQPVAELYSFSRASTAVEMRGDEDRGAAGGGGGDYWDVGFSDEHMRRNLAHNPWTTTASASASGGGGGARAP